MLPTELSWNILLLIPKGNTYTCGIGLLEFLWKVVEAIIDTWIKTAVTFHDVLHGFCAYKSTRTAITELNMSQELASIVQDPLLLVFLDLRKAYNTLDRGRLLQPLKGYREVPNMRGILVELWEN